MRAVVALERNVVIRIAFVGDHPVIHKLIEAFNRFGRGRVRAGASIRWPPPGALRR